MGMGLLFKKISLKWPGRKVAVCFCIPHACDVSGVIVLASSVSVCVCYHSHGQMDRQTDLNFGM